MNVVLFAAGAAALGVVGFVAFAMSLAWAMEKHPFALGLSTLFLLLFTGIGAGVTYL